MKKVVITADRLNQQRTATNIRSLVLEQGEELSFVTQIQATANRNGVEVPNDSLLFNSNKRGAVRMTVSELNRLKTAEGFLTGNEDFEVPHKLIIKSSSPRKSNQGTFVYPTSAYKGANDFYAAIQRNENPDYNKLVESGLKDENAKPVQDYVVEVAG